MKLIDWLAILLALGAGVIGFSCFNGCGPKLIQALPGVLALGLAVHSAASLRRSSAQMMATALPQRPSELVPLANAIVAKHSTLLSFYVPVAAPSDWKRFESTKSENRIGSLVTPAAAIGLSVMLMFSMASSLETTAESVGRFTELLRGSPLGSSLSTMIATLLTWSFGTFASLAAFTHWSKK